jgi:hypothetical protein
MAIATSRADSNAPCIHDINSKTGQSCAEDEHADI